MVLTSLKPLDQTMLQPQSWLPRRYEAEMGGRMQEVRPGAAVTEPSVWATQEGAPQPVALPEDSIRDGVWIPAEGSPLAVTVIKKVPASRSLPWREITDLRQGAMTWCRRPR